ncbi:MAG: corrinoid protein [Acidobacteriia bacterium]|nr:corrinoid protein [Terriglobia bacterium]
MTLADDILEQIKLSIVDMEDQKAVALTRQALADHPAEEILNRALIPAMELVGNEYEQGQKFIPEMLLAAEAMTSALELLKPQLARSDVKKVGKVVMGTVEGDVHDIGQRMVCIMLEGAGFEVLSLGADVATHEFVNAVKTKSPDILGMSALLTTTAPRMKGVIEALQKEGLRNRVKIMVGGAILNQRLADEYGADGYAPDAASATRLARTLMEDPRT